MMYIEKRHRMIPVWPLFFLYYHSHYTKKIMYYNNNDKNKKRTLKITIDSIVSFVMT